LKRTFSDETERIITEEFAAGKSSYCLAEEYSSNPTTIKNVIVRSGTQIRRPCERRFTDEQEEKITAEYFSGNSTVVLGRKYNCHSSTINTAIRRCGKKPNQKRFTPEQEKIITEEYTAGKSTVQLAK
jgi:Mor family transcriptional regulator